MLRSFSKSNKMSAKKSHRIADWAASFAISIALVTAQVWLLQFGLVFWPLFFLGIGLQLIVLPPLIFAVIRVIREQ